MSNNQLKQNPNYPLYVIVYAQSAPNPGFYVVVNLQTLLPSPTQEINAATQWRTQGDAVAYLALNQVAIGAAEIRPTYHVPAYYSSILPQLGPE
jgi:hypothetical protein